MSKIQNLGKHLEKLPDVLGEYEDLIEDVRNILKIKGKTLKEANRDAEHQFFYDEKKRELNALVKYIESMLFATRGRLYRALTENNPRELSDRAKDRYIDNEQDYLTMNGIYLEVKEMAEKYDAIVESFRSRGYAVNNLTKLVISGTEEYII